MLAPVVFVCVGSQAVLCLPICAAHSRPHCAADMALQAASVCCVVLMFSILHPSAADPVTDTKLQAGELDVLRGDIAALKPRVTAGELMRSNICFGVCSWWSLWFVACNSGGRTAR